MHRSKLHLAQATALAAIVILAYLPAFRARYIWDDDQHITHNQALTSLQGLSELWLAPGMHLPQWYPLAHSTLWLNYQMSGLNPVSYHATNIVIQIFSALALWRLLARLRVPGAWAAAAIWAVHPLQVETVAWITERKNLLSGLFLILALHCYLRCENLDCDQPPSNQRFAIGWYLSALLLFVAALLSKTIASSMPVVMLLLIWWKRGQVQLGQFIRAWPLLIIGAIFGSITQYMELHYVGAVGPAFEFTALQRLSIASRAFWFYPLKLLFPYQLSFNYRRWQIADGLHWPLLLGMAAVLLLAGLWLARRRIGRGPFTAMLLYGVLIAPASGIFVIFPMQYSFVADHFQYLAGLAPLILLTAALATHLPRWSSMVLACGALAVLSVLTFQRCIVFHDSQSLWTDTLKKNRQSWMAHNWLGAIAYNQQHDADAAEKEFRAAIAISGCSYWAYEYLGIIADGRGEPAAALGWYDLALQHFPNSDSPVLLSDRAQLARRIADAQSNLAKTPRPISGN